MENIKIKLNYTMSDTEAALRSRLLRRNAENADLRNELDAAYILIAELSDELASIKSQLARSNNEKRRLNDKMDALASALDSYCLARYLQ